MPDDAQQSHIKTVNSLTGQHAYLDTTGMSTGHTPPPHVTILLAENPFDRSKKRKSLSKASKSSMGSSAQMNNVYKGNVAAAVRKASEELYYSH